MITREPIEPAKLLAAVLRPGHGGQASFFGTVRDHHEGRAVSAVTYEAFEPLAEKALRELVERAEARHGAKVAAAHRLGTLPVGEISVGIAAGAEHREQAFAACREVLEEIKKRLPVWKKERYADGSESWLAGCALARE